MTTREHDAIAVLTGHVMELKQDMGEVKADVRSIKEGKAADRDARHWSRSHLFAILALVVSALGLAHTFIS